MATRKYQVYKKQVSYDGGETWEDVLPVETVKMPVYGETCKVDYAAEVWVGNGNGYIRDGIGNGDRKLPPMDILTERAVDFLTGDLEGYTSEYICPGLFIGTGVTEVGSSAFTNYTGGYKYGETVFFEEPSSVRTIRNKAFFKHPYRRVIRIPDSVETIEDYAFATSGYTSLRYVEIGSGCTHIGREAFNDVKGWNTKGVVCVMKGNTPPQLDGVNNVGGSPFGANIGGYTVLVPSEALSSYRSDRPEWQSISGNVTTDSSLGNVAKAETNSYYTTWDGQYGAEYPTICQIPNDGSTTLTSSDFECTEGETIPGDTGVIMSWLKVGDSVKTIPNDAFSAYGTSTNLAYLNLGNGVETIGNNAFKSQAYIRDLDIPDSVKTIGNNAFDGCKSLTNLKIGSGCTRIGDYAFSSCSRLTNIEIGDNVDYIGDNAFGVCLELRIDDSFKLPEAVRKIGNNAFKINSLQYSDDVVMLKRFEIPSGIDTIGNNALEPLMPDILEIGGCPSAIGSGICSPRVAVTIGATTPPTVMVTSDETHGSIIDNPDKIGWMKTALIYVPDNFIDTYKTTYGWCYLRQHMFPLSEISNMLNFASEHKFCGLYPKQGGTVPPYSTNKEQGVFKYGEYDGSTTLTSGETKYGYSDNTPPAILWVGDNVEYVDSNVGSYATQHTNVIIFGTGLKSFKFISGGYYGSITSTIYVFKTSTPPEFDCQSVFGTSGRTYSTLSSFYVPDDAVDTYKEWLKNSGVRTYRLENGGDYCPGDVPTDDFNVRPISDLYYLSDNLRKRWVEVPGQYQYGCSGTSKVRLTIEKEQTTTDWVNWTDTGRVRTGDGEVIEHFSYECGHTPYTGKLRGTKDDGTVVEVPCDGSSTLSRNNTSTARNQLTAYIEIGDCTSFVGASAFTGCNFIQELVLSTSVEGIGQYAFARCGGLSSLTIPDSFESFGSSAFYQCSGLTSVTIGSGCTSIGEMAFANCSSLSSMTLLATTPPSLGGNVFSGSPGCIFYVPLSALEDYKTANRWSNYADRIQPIS